MKVVTRFHHNSKEVSTIDTSDMAGQQEELRRRGEEALCQESKAVAARLRKEAQTM
jgi:hypothetical protein